MRIEPADWYAVKQLIEHSTGWSMDTLHVIAGVVLQLLFAALLRRSIADWRPLALVLLVELGNEGLDLWVERWPSLAMQLGEGLRDVIGTMLLPVLLCWLARTRPALLGGAR